MAKNKRTLKFDPGAAFETSRLKRLHRKNTTWEADFRALPTPLIQSTTHYLGLVVQQDGSVLHQTHVEGRPSASDLAALLAQAMKQPLAGTAHRPRRLHVRGHHQWRELFPRLKELAIDVSVRQELPKVKSAYEDHLRQLRKAARNKMVRPTDEQAAVEKLFPAIARWVRGYGHIEIGDQESFGFVVRALDYGGLVFEDDKAETLAEAMAALVRGLTEHIEREQIE